MGWWPFGRKRKTQKSDAAEPRTAQKPSVKENKGRSNNDARKPPKATHSTDDPFRDPAPRSHSEKVYSIPYSPSPPSPPIPAHGYTKPQRTSTPPRQLSTEDITALPRSPRKRQSPRLRPVPVPGELDSDLECYTID